jgi:hypothetical protein
VTNARIALPAGTVLGALLGLGVVVVVWNAVEHLNVKGRANGTASGSGKRDHLVRVFAESQG